MRFWLQLRRTCNGNFSDEHQSQKEPTPRNGRVKHHARAAELYRKQIYPVEGFADIDVSDWREYAFKLATAIIYWSDQKHLSIVLLVFVLSEEIYIYYD